MAFYIYWDALVYSRCSAIFSSTNGAANRKNIYISMGFYFLKRIYKFLILILYININMFNKYQCFYIPNRELSYDCTDGGVLIYSNRYNRISFESNNLKNIGTLFFVFRFHLNKFTEMEWISIFLTQSNGCAE